MFYCMNFCVWMAAMCPCQTMKSTVYFCLFYCTNFCVWMAAVCPCQTMKTEVYFCLFYCMNFCVWMATMCHCQTLKTTFYFCLLYEFLCVDGSYVSMSDFENYILFLFYCMNFSLPVRQQKLCLIFSVLLYELMCVDGSVCFFLPVRQKLFLFVLVYEFFCLGGSYVSLSDNEKTGYKARELKSVHVDALGTFLRLNIHKNHINKHNLYNQVTCGVCVCVCMCVLMGKGTGCLLGQL